MVLCLWKRAHLGNDYARWLSTVEVIEEAFWVVDKQSIEVAEVPSSVDTLNQMMVAHRFLLPPPGPPSLLGSTAHIIHAFKVWAPFQLAQRQWSLSPEIVDVRCISLYLTTTKKVKKIPDIRGWRACPPKDHRFAVLTHRKYLCAMRTNHVNMGWEWVCNSAFWELMDAKELDRVIGLGCRVKTPVPHMLVRQCNELMEFHFVSFAFFFSSLPLRLATLIIRGSFFFSCCYFGRPYNISVDGISFSPTIMYTHSIQFSVRWEARRLIAFQMSLAFCNTLFRFAHRTSDF